MLSLELALLDKDYLVQENAAFSMSLEFTVVYSLQQLFEKKAMT